MNAVLGGTLVVGAVFIGLNLLSDLLYRLSIRGRDEHVMHARSPVARLAAEPRRPQSRAPGARSGSAYRAWLRLRRAIRWRCVGLGIVVVAAR